MEPTGTGRDDLGMGQAFLDRTSNIDSPRCRFSGSRVGHCSLGRHLSWRPILAGPKCGRASAPRLPEALQTNRCRLTLAIWRSNTGGDASGGFNRRLSYPDMV